MEWNQMLAERIAEIKTRKESESGVGAEDKRREAMEYLKQNGYELTETNVQLALKNLGTETKNKEKIIADIMEKPIDEIVDLYNEEIAELIGLFSTGVNPAYLLSEDETVKNSFYTILEIDARAYNALETRDILRNGFVGRTYITQDRILLNYLPSVFPEISTICFDRKDICSLAIRGCFSNEIEIVLHSGQKIKVNVPISENVNVIKALY
jgi:hypothetical protein